MQMEHRGDRVGRTISIVPNPSPAATAMRRPSLGARLHWLSFGFGTGVDNQESALPRLAIEASVVNTGRSNQADQFSLDVEPFSAVLAARNVFQSRSHIDRRRTAQGKSFDKRLRYVSQGCPDPFSGLN